MANDLLAAKAEAKTLSGLDALEIASQQKVTTRAGRIWANLWPKFAAIGLVILVWQILVWFEWKPTYSLPSPAMVFGDLGEYVTQEAFWSGLATTGRRAAVGFGAALTIGLLLGLAVARIRILRAAIGSMITAMQTMPSIAWFPLAILLFQLSEQAIFFVVVLGAAPSIANGVIYGLDYIPPLLLRAGRNVGARGLSLYRYVIVPAALPAIIAGLKQGWAFAWRSLMAGELLVVIASKTSIGFQLTAARELADAERLMSIMIEILVLGILVDAAFGAADRAVRRRWGVLDRANS
ncbi:ABC transporter permease [Phytohabitans rumicis]|uniref:Sulfate ABC transporter permease n=1 Tax=Phytohabitans rumicis TaxID=1076125 RepID=A0A6V8L763_9ACTN|nr:ABC transporter permease [Phytohabitans rumicis]GFJ91400.1 sulfate ABC transporter permease [Phytohabitans rumicis]